jgi:hypothetical protein
LFGSLVAPRHGNLVVSDVFTRKRTTSLPDSIRKFPKRNQFQSNAVTSKM